jgi:DNA polymerase-1
MTTSSDRTYLIDGSGYIFRAFFAIQRLSTKSGFPTNALFGFLKMIQKTVSEANSSKIAIIFDAGKKTFRNDLYPEYKANRTECPPELLEQMPYFSELSRALGLPVLLCPGYEADDIIATLTSKLVEKKQDVVIVSGDKDLMQLVSEHVQIWDTMKDKHYDIEGVKEKFGVPPSQVTEVLGLMGDSSDNVPGVDGIGPKTATQLIQKYGTVENIITKVEEIKNDPEIRNRKKIGESIESGLEILRLSRKLVEVDPNVPLDEIQDGSANIEELLTKKELDVAHLRELFEKFEFHSLFKDFQRILGASHNKEIADGFDYKAVLADDFADWVRSLAAQGEFSFDLETTSLSLHEAQIVGASFCWDDSSAWYVPLGHKGESGQVSWNDFAEATREIFADRKVSKCGQNLKYDIGVLGIHGIPVEGVTFDSMVAAYLLNPDSRSFNLTALAHEFLQLPVIEYDVVTEGAQDFSEVTIPKATRYACQDAHYAWLLKGKLLPMIDEAGLAKVFNVLEVPLIPLLARMESVGVKVDRARLKQMSVEFEDQLKGLESRIYELAGCEFNINSTKQLAEVLFTKLGISTKGVKKTKSGFSTDSSVLEKLSETHDLPKLILEFRSLHKLKSTYTDALQEDVCEKTGRVHTRLNQTITSTGRLSSSDPNLQNIPIKSKEGGRIRSAFIPEKGSFFVAADYSQIELRLLAHLSSDENLIRAFKEGTDIHANTAREIMGLSQGDEVTDNERRVGKTINFGIVYGMGAFRLGKELGIPVGQASSYIQNYFSRYPRVKAYFAKLEEAALSNGEVQTIFGRKRVISSIDTSGRDQGFALRAAINAPLQGSAADIIKVAMIEVDKLLREKFPASSLILQIHDELLIEAPDHGAAKNKELLDAVQQAMEGVMELSVPLKVDVGSGHSWQEAQG